MGVGGGDLLKLQWSQHCQLGVIKKKKSYEPHKLESDVNTSMSE